MPIDLATFERLPDEGDAQTTEIGRTHAERVVSYLAEHSEEAFTLTELREALDVPRGSIGVTMTHLEDDDAVRHRGGHWALRR